MDKEQFYQMRLQRDIFESRKTHRDTDFSFKVIDNNNPLHIRDNISHLKFICKSIDNNLPEWKGKPVLDTCLERLKTSSLFLLFHKDFNKALGWMWASEMFTYNWIDNLHKLPINNSVYVGGAYIQKNINPPPNTGLQLYFQFASYFLQKYENIFGYMDKWNRASIYISHEIKDEDKFIKLRRDRIHKILGPLLINNDQNQDNSNNVKMSISSSGRVGIGTTAPGRFFQIATGSSLTSNGNHKVAMSINQTDTTNNNNANTTTTNNNNKIIMIEIIIVILIIMIILIIILII